MSYMMEFAIRKKIGYDLVLHLEGSPALIFLNVYFPQHLSWMDMKNGFLKIDKTPLKKHGRNIIELF